MKSLHLHDEDIEASTLACCMMNEEFLGIVIDELNEDYFYNAGFPALWSNIKSTFLAGKQVTPHTIKACYTDGDQKEAILELAGAYICHSPEEQARDYLSILQDLYQKRELSWKLDEVAAQLEEADSDTKAGQLIDELESFVFNLGDIKQTNGPTLDGRMEALKQIEAAHKTGSIAGISTGFPSIDKIISGMGNSDLVILAGRPSMGKTALALKIAEYAAEHTTTLFCSLEMAKEQIEGRRLAMASGYDVGKMRRGELTQDELRALTNMTNPTKLWIDDSAALKPTQLLARARRLKRQHDLGFIVVDYLQLMEASNIARRQGSVQSATEISKMLKLIAKELNVPVLALSQLSRGVESRDNKRPMLSDLRESGAIEQDADAVLFCYRDEYYLERNEPQQWERETKENFETRRTEYTSRLLDSKGKAEVIVAKNRHGPIGTAMLGFEAHTTRFHELYDNDYLPMQSNERAGVTAVNRG